MAPVAFGIFDHIDRSDEPLATLFEHRLRLVEAADAAGFRTYHVAEHHATRLGMAPSPGIFLAAVAQRTRRLRFGPLVYLLPLYTPLRLIEEICMLDQLSHGRFELGVGRGIVPYELAYCGINFMDAQEIYEESLEIILAGLRGGKLTHQGRHYTYRGVHIVSTLGNAPLKQVAQSFYEAGGKSLLVGAQRHVLVADTDEDAMKLARPAYLRWYESLTSLWRAFNSIPFRFSESLEKALANDVAIVGSPATVRAEVERHIATTGCNYFVGRFMYGNLPHEVAARSMDLFAREVMPHFSR
jgi:alkanesulfonate monooxygenase SsuD/methylene tetrahydromethanopterin reductase-like flavin-dependent oxidoreductase (luciferase family)